MNDTKMYKSYILFVVVIFLTSCCYARVVRYTNETSPNDVDVMKEIELWDKHHRVDGHNLKNDKCLSANNGCNNDDDCCGTCTGFEKESGYKYCV